MGNDACVAPARRVSDSTRWGVARRRPALDPRPFALETEDMKTRKSLLFAGAGITALFLFPADVEVLSAQALPTTLRSSWPPHPSRSVSQTGSADLFTPNQTADIIAAPSNRWLVLTDLRIASQAAPEILRIDASGSTVLVGTLQTPVMHRWVGMAIPPGSRLALRATSNATTPTRWHLTGYWEAPHTTQEWPPKADTIINVAGKDSLATGAAPVPMYQVPANRWFVLTSFWEAQSNGTHEIVEIDGGQVTTKLFAWHTHLTDTGSYHGVAFAPGSTVALRHQGTGGSPNNIHWSATGYLVDP